MAERLYETKYGKYKVMKKSEHYYAVIDSCGIELTSGTSFDNARKKSDLLEKGFEQARDLYCNWLRD